MCGPYERVVPHPHPHPPPLKTADLDSGQPGGSVEFGCPGPSAISALMPDDSQAAPSGDQSVVRPPSLSVLTQLHQPFSLCCIAPVLAAKVIKGVEVTVGHEQEEGGKWPYAGTAEAIKALGAKHCVKGVTISFLAAGQCGVG